MSGEYCRFMQRLASGALVLIALTGCGLKPDPPPNIPTIEYGGMGDRMAQCTAYASVSYCEQQIWGGGER